MQLREKLRSREARKNIAIVLALAIGVPFLPLWGVLVLPALPLILAWVIYKNGWKGGRGESHHFKQPLAQAGAPEEFVACQVVERPSSFSLLHNDLRHHCLVDAKDSKS